ncbi:MAG: hypothetical protein ILP18_07855 [Treponema sp.]|nr:hypothetical protein [Treponema sp.]
MYRYKILKFLFLTALYAAVIIGVFILQFKTETIISRNIGGMELSLSSAKDKDNNDILRNRFRIEYEGLTFSSDTNNAAFASLPGKEEPEPLVLESWAKDSGNEIKLRFGGGAAISFTSCKSNATVSTEGASSGPLLTITAELPENYESISIPYAISSSYSIEQDQRQGQGKDDAGSLTLQRGEDYFKLSGPSFASTSPAGLVTFARATPAAFYTAFVPVREFQFESVAALPLTDDASYDASKAALRSELKSKFQAALNANSSLAEKAVVAYLADMAMESRFNIAMNSIPASFKNSSSRTYLSTPYLANVIPLSSGLRRKEASLGTAVRNATGGTDIGFFLLDGISDWLLIHKMDADVKAALAIPATLDESQLSLREAAAILKVYVQLDTQDASFADNLGVSIEKCLSVIRKYLTLDGTTIVVGKRADAGEDEESEAGKEAPLSRMERILLGQTLRSYGDTIGDSAIMETGNLLVNQDMQDIGSFSLADLSDLYPRLISENRFYPHVQILGYYGKKATWAWTCAPNIDYKVARNGTTDINIDYTLSYTHYVTFAGIPTFHNKIQIQNLDFHTDKNYEMWNSSGFVYDEQTQDFYLKSRHKSKIELIRLFCDPAPNFVSVTHPAS